VHDFGARTFAITHNFAKTTARRYMILFTQPPVTAIPTAVARDAKP
jgi:hypothetical protein